MGKLKLTLEQRKRAFDLLAQSHSVETALHNLHSTFHPSEEVREVEAAYFPRGGVFRNRHLEGRPAGEIMKAYEKAVKLSNAAGQRFKTLFKDPQFMAQHAVRWRKKLREKWENKKYRKQMVDIGRKALADARQRPENKAAAGRQGREVLTRLWKTPEYRDAKKREASATMMSLHRDPVFAARHSKRASATLMRLRRDEDFNTKMAEAARRGIKRRLEEPEYREMLSENGRRTVRKLWEDAAFIERHVQRNRERFLKLRKSPEWVKMLEAKKIAGTKKKWRDPHYRRLMSALAKARSFKLRMKRGGTQEETAKQRAMVETPGGWEGTGTRRPVPLHIGEIESEIDLFREMRRGIEALPLRQQFLVASFLKLNLPNVQEAEEAANQELLSWEVKKELEAALATLKNIPIWKELLEE